MHFRANFSLIPRSLDVWAQIPQGLAGSPNYFRFLNNLVTFTNCESLKEIGEMLCVTPARSLCGQTLNSLIHLLLVVSVDFSLYNQLVISQT